VQVQEEEDEDHQLQCEGNSTDTTTDGPLSMTQKQELQKQLVATVAPEAASSSQVVLTQAVSSSHRPKSCREPVQLAGRAELAAQRNEAHLDFSAEKASHSLTAVKIRTDTASTECLAAHTRTELRTAVGLPTHRPSVMLQAVNQQQLDGEQREPSPPPDSCETAILRVGTPTPLRSMRQCTLAEIASRAQSISDELEKSRVALQTSTLSSDASRPHSPPFRSPEGSPTPPILALNTSSTRSAAIPQSPSASIPKHNTLEARAHEATSAARSPAALEESIQMVSPSPHMTQERKEILSTSSSPAWVETCDRISRLESALQESDAEILRLKKVLGLNRNV